VCVCVCVCVCVSFSVLFPQFVMIELMLRMLDHLASHCFGVCIVPEPWGVHAQPYRALGGKQSLALSASFAWVVYDTATACGSHKQGMPHRCIRRSAALEVDHVSIYYRCLAVFRFNPLLAVYRSRGPLCQSHLLCSPPPLSGPVSAASLFELCFAQISRLPLSMRDLTSLKSLRLQCK
jgi:hypothetical protein